MSADNGIYIAKFPKGYRIIYSSAIDNLSYFESNTSDYFYEFDNYWKDSPRFETKNEAYIFAQYLYEKYGDELEYGICDLGTFHFEPEFNNKMPTDFSSYLKEYNKKRIDNAIEDFITYIKQYVDPSDRMLEHYKDGIAFTIRKNNLIKD